MVGGDEVDEEVGGDVLEREVVVSGISSVFVVDGVCLVFATMAFLITIFSDFEGFAGMKESSEDFVGDGLKVSAWRCLLTFLSEVGTKSRGFRFPPGTPSLSCF